jgi:pteridine reductase
MSEHPLALVTGAAHRLGRVFALALASQGYDILLHYNISEEAAYQTKIEIESMGVQVFLSQSNLADLNGINTLLIKLMAIPSKLSVLINSASFMASGRIESLTSDEWDNTLNINLRAPFFLVQKVAPLMVDGGLIVNITDVGAQKTWSRYPSYTVSKAALDTLTKILARGLAPSIRVNAIALGFVMQSEIVSPEEWERLINRVPLKRAAQNEEVVSALEFLLRNQYITGQIIVVDGGYSLINE